MDRALTFVLHHAEAVDPDLVDWLRHQIDAVLGVDALAIVIVLAVVIVAFPVAIGYATLRQRRAQARRRSQQ